MSPVSSGSLFESSAFIGTKYARLVTVSRIASVNCPKDALPGFQERLYIFDKATGPLGCRAHRNNLKRS